MKGFWINKLSALGENKKIATVSLTKGTNLITGPSDTGKSYLFSIIDYVLGRTKPPKDINEGIGYNIFRLNITAYETEIEYLLERKINKNRVSVWKINKGVNEDDTLVEIFNTKGSLSSDNNLSTFLLKLCGLENTILLKNRTKGEKINLSFKNLIQFTNISEERIITESSPFYFTNIPMNRIVEQSMISSILESEDFSSVKAIEDPKKKETRISGKLEFIDKQIIRYTEQRAESSDSNERNKAKWNFNLGDINRKLESKISSSRKLEIEIQDCIKSINQLVEDRIYNSELLNRFKILERQYLSDLDRLDFILEAEALTEQLPSQVCPICLNPMNENQIHHLDEIDNFKAAVAAEAITVKQKLEDLNFSVENTNELLIDINRSHITKVDSLSSMQTVLEDVKPDIENLQNIIGNLLAKEKITNRIEFIDDEMEKLYAEKDNLEKQKGQKEETEIVNLCDYDLLKELSKCIEKRLSAWSYDNNPKVIFNSETKIFDIVISSRSRGSYGKGRRAISYTACVLGFLDYCLSKKRNFHNFIVIDSPLTTFRDAENSGEEESIEDLESLFFSDIKTFRKECQIIIIDNKVPKDLNGLNLVRFTKNKNIGRYGFIPM